MNKKNGFTLVELLVTVVLLGIVATIIVFNVTNVANSGKKADYEKFVSRIKSSASLYADMNPATFQDLYENKAFIYVTINDLIVSGKLDEDTVNPYTGTKVGRDELVKVSLDTTTAALTFTYPVDESEENKETFMVALNDYVVWGEAYDCMQGLGTYQLALSDEEGNLITDVNKLKNDYHLTCSFPNEFEKQSDGKYSTTIAGNYDITYNWITESGIKKSFTRTLNVNTKVKPGFKTYYDNKETTYDFDDLKNGKMWATPEYIASENRWKYLTYKPYIEGADEETTTYNIKVQSRNPVGTEFYVAGSQNNYIGDFTTKYDAYDGDVLYTIRTIVRGHHDKDYSYDAEGQYNMRQKLVLAKEYVNDIASNWTIDKDFIISDVIGKKNVPIYSKYGIAKFEYRLSNEEVKADSIVDDNFVFNKVKNDNTLKNVNVRYPFESCKAGLKYQNIYIRPINTNGYIGEWTKLDAYLTNQVDLLLQTDSVGCNECKKCCKPDSSGSCSYCDKNKYLKINNYRFIALERYKNGTIKATYDGISGKCEYASTTVSGRWEVRTCDGLFRANYTVTRVVENKIKAKAGETISGIDAYLVTRSSGNVSNVTKAEFKKYAAALYADEPYWTITVRTTLKRVYVSEPYNHGDSTTVTNSYYYVVNKNKLTEDFYGNCNYVKPIVVLKTLYTCEGDGTSDSPYIVL